MVSLSWATRQQLCKLLKCLKAKKIYLIVKTSCVKSERISGLGASKKILPSSLCTQGGSHVSKYKYSMKTSSKRGAKK